VVGRSGLEPMAAACPVFAKSALTRTRAKTELHAF